MVSVTAYRHRRAPPGRRRRSRRPPPGGLPRHRGAAGVISWTGNPPAPNGSAPRAIRARYATVPGEASAVRRKIRRGSPAGTTGAGTRDTSRAGLSRPSLRAHTGHRWRCRPARPRRGAVSAPPRPAARAASSGQVPGPARPAAIASHAPNRDRDRPASACTRAAGTPSTSARSAPPRPWRRPSSISSPSAGLSAASAACTTAGRPARPSPTPGPAAAAASPAA